METINEAYHEFHNELLAIPHRNDIPVLLFCNKQDLSNAMTPKDIQLRMGFYREKKYKKLDLKKIQTNSIYIYYRKYLFLAMEYAKDYENGICVKRTAEQLKFRGISLIDQAFGVYTKILDNDNYLKSYNCDYDYIVGIICDYLPIYEYNDESADKYGLFGICAISGNNLLNAIEWMEQQFNKKKRSNKKRKK